MRPYGAERSAHKMKKGRHTPAGIDGTHVCRQSKRTYFSSFTALERGSITLTT